MPKKDYKDFLHDDLFLYWRVHPTKELDNFWEEFILRNKKLKGPFEEAIDAFEEIRGERGPEHFDEKALLHKLELALRQEKKKIKTRRLFSSIAAAMLLVVTISTIVFLYERPVSNEGSMPTLGQVMNDNSIQLFTGTDILEIEDNSTLNFSEKEQSAVIRNPLSRKEIDLNDNQINTLVVPYGKRSSLILADGSEIFLNSGTKIEFPSGFSGGTREINVVGEVFIDVANQNGTPFVIHTPRSMITVYGTSFNVSSYEEDESESVVLVSGLVEVKSNDYTTRLVPNEMATIEEDRIVKKKVEVSEYTSWKEGYMQLSKTPLDEVLIKVGRYYNKEFKYDPSLDLSSQTCSGKLFLSDDFTDVLDAFSKMTYLEYNALNDATILIE